MPRVEVDVRDPALASGRVHDLHHLVDALPGLLVDAEVEPDRAEAAVLPRRPVFALHPEVTHLGGIHGEVGALQGPDAPHGLARRGLLLVPRGARREPDLGTGLALVMQDVSNLAPRVETTKLVRTLGREGLHHRGVHVEPGRQDELQSRSESGARAHHGAAAVVLHHAALVETQAPAVEIQLQEARVDARIEGDDGEGHGAQEVGRPGGTARGGSRAARWVSKRHG